MNRADTIWNGTKLTLIGLLTVLFILALSFENADGMSSASFHFYEPVLTEEAPSLNSGPGLQLIQLNNGYLDPNNFDREDYRPYIGGENIGDQFDPPTSVPEPTTVLLLGMGLVGAGLARRRNRAK